VLTAPAYRDDVLGVTVFADDTLFYRFYPIPKAPGVRLDANGKPVFLLVKYAFSDEDRQRDPKLPAGGGYVSFDVAFEIPEETLARVRAALQQDVDARWHELKAGSAADQARPGVAGTTAPPAVELGSPTWTGGKVSLDAPQSTALVSARVAEAAPSLLSGNVAVFNLDLTPAGATFMQETLTGGSGGGGATDLTPIQVAYDLKFWARLPPVAIHVQADSEKIYDYLEKQLQGRGVDGCTTYDFDHSDITTESAHASGAVSITIDNGSGSVPQTVVDQLTQFALSLVQKMVESSFFDSSPQDGAAHPDATAPTGKTFLKKKDQVTRTHIQFDLAEQAVVEWPIHPQATLETFFRGMPAQEIAPYVRVIDLADDFFSNLELTVRAFTDWSDKAVSHVEVEVRYAGTDETGAAQEKHAAFTFTGSDPQTWKVGLIGGERSYQYRSRVGFLGQDPGRFSAWTASASPQLDVDIPEPGRVEVEVLAGDVDFPNLVDGLQVVLAYEDPDQGVGREEYTISLGSTKLEDTYRRLIYKPRTQPVHWKSRWKLKSGEVREDAAWQAATGSRLVVNQAFDDVLKANLLPAGNGWDDIVQVMVDLHYQDDGNQYTVDDTLPLRAATEAKSWRVFLKDPAVKGFRYRTTASFKNGHLEQSGWQSATGDATLPIVVVRPGIRVAVLADTLDFAACPVTEVTLRYAGPDSQSSRQETFVFRDKTPQTWDLDVPAGTPVDFTYQVTHSPAGRDPVTLPPVRSTDTVVVLPAYRQPKGGKLQVQVFGSLVDFAATPIVTVDLRYDDDGNGEHEAGTLTLTERSTQTWSVDVKDASLRQFGYRVTYYTPDSAAHAADWKFQDAPRIILPKLAL
jgi:hypothetical protein